MRDRRLPLKRRRVRCPGAFASAEVQGADWVQDALTPGVLAQIGRDLIRQGGSLHVIALVGGASPRVRLLPAASWSFTGADDPDTWRVEATTSGPSGTVTRNLPYHGVIFCAWGHEPGRGYSGIGPTAWASTTARLGAETERSIADEAGGPIANLLAVPQDGGSGDADDPLADLKTDIAKARGKALLVETTAAGWGEGPRRCASKGLGRGPAGAELSGIYGNHPGAGVHVRPGKLRHSPRHV